MRFPRKAPRRDRRATTPPTARGGRPEPARGAVPRPTLPFRRPLVLGLSLALGGCSGDVNPIKAAFVEAGHGPKAVAAPDFVAKSRREGMDYMPVGVSAPRPALRPRSSEAQTSLEAELESARTANEARGRAAEGAAKATGKGLAAKPADKGAAAPADAR